MTRFEALRTTCELAEAYIAQAASETEDYVLIWILGILLDYEDVLDRGRSVYLDGPETDEDAKLSEVNRRMDALRGEIVTLMQRLGKERVTHFLQQRANATLQQFTHNL